MGIFWGKKFKKDKNAKIVTFYYMKIAQLLCNEEFKINI